MTGSVLILGASVAGMHAATELLRQGFRIYLLEEAPDFPANMARIEQLFPANEDAACALQPIILDLVNNPNATILTSSELLSLRGQAGDFTVEILSRQAEDSGRPPKLELTVGAVIVPARLEEERDESLERLGYGKFPNVLTELEFERKVLGLESTGGAIRLTNGRELGRVAWVVREEDSPESFISATAQALGVREMNKDAQVSILYKKRLTDGKGCEGCYREAERQGVDYIQASAVEVGHTMAGTLVLFYTSGDGKRAQLETEMLILPTPQVPNIKTRALAERLGLELDENGYFRKDSKSGHPVLSSRDGVFLYGATHGAKGIGESIIQAGAAAAHAAVLLAPVRGNGLDEPTEKKLLPVKATDEPKIAVVIDKNGTAVASPLDWDELGKYTRTLPGVECVEVTSCASDGSKIRELLGTGNFNRLIVAGPSPIPHEPRFQRHVEQAGLNRYLLEMVNLHDQCVRVHSSNKAEATEKAKILMRMGVARARLLEPLDDLEFMVTQSCLVVGGTPSGVACAAKLAKMGIHVHLVEGVSGLERIPGNDHHLVAPLVADLLADNKVEVHAPATVNEVQGCVGDFKVELVQSGKKLTVEVGAIVVATRDRGTIGVGFEKSLVLTKDQDGFYLSTQGILNLLDFTTEGVFNCGPARAALEIEDAVVEGEAAASRVAGVLASPMMVKAPVVSRVVEENCDGCAYCVEPCPTRTITLLEFMQRGEIKKVVEVNKTTCIGCGICMATCPKKGIFVSHFKPEYFSEMIKAALEESDSQPVILSFCCNRCAYPGADAAGSAGIQYPTSVKIIRTVCTGMIHPNIIMDALTQGADGVLLCGCHPGNCRSREGIRKAQSRAESIALMLEDFGLEPERFRLEFIAASEGPKFAKVVNEMTAALSALGPNPYR